MIEDDEVVAYITRDHIEDWMGTELSRHDWMRVQETRQWNGDIAEAMTNAGMQVVEKMLEELEIDYGQSLH